MPETRMEKMLELQNMMFRRQQARERGVSYPSRLLKEDIARRRTPKERERGWINDYKRGDKPKKPFGYLDEQLVLSRKILSRELDNPQTFIASLNSYKGQNAVKMERRESRWPTNSIHKEHTVNESLYGMSKPSLYSHQSQLHTKAEFKILQNKKLEHDKKLETGWVSFGREQGNSRTGSGVKLGRPRGLTSSELQSLRKARAKKQEERESTTGGTTERSTVSHQQKSSGSPASLEKQRQKYSTRLVVPIGTLERSGFGIASYRASITPEGQRDKYNQLVETGWVHRYDAAGRKWPESECSKERRDEDVLKQGIEKEEEEGWMSNYRRKQSRELCKLAKQRDKTASEVLKESHNRYREGGWINPLQRQKPGVYALGLGFRGSRRTAAEIMRSA